MKPDIRSYISIAIAILFILPILAITPVQTQITAATIRSVSSPAYPGRPVNITVDVGLATTVTVSLCPDATCTAATWATQSFTPAQPGTYTLSVVLPKLLPGATDADANDMIDLYVRVSTVFGTVFQKVDVAPLIEVTPIQTANVYPNGTSKSVTINFYGFVPGSTISSVDFSGPITASSSVSLTVHPYGNTSVVVQLVPITGYGLPRGAYDVNCTVSGTDMTYAKLGRLAIVPQAIISPVEGNGRCDDVICESYNIVIEGYGFDPDVSVTRIDLLNLNFTNVVYSNTSVDVTTNSYGYFEATNLFETNMSAGLYIPIVYTAPTPRTLTNSSTIDIETKGSVNVTQSAIYDALGTKASVTATSFVNGTWQYVEKYSTMSYTLSEVLRIDFTEAGKNYRLAANLEVGGIRFTLYNITPAIPVTLDTRLVPTTWNGTLGAYIAHYSFNITPSVTAIGAAPATPGEYRYWATFYNYTNMILLRLRVYDFVVTNANLTIVYSNVDTGVTKSFYYGNLSQYIVAGTATVTVPKFRDADIEWTIEWSMTLPAGATTYTATLSVTGQPLKGPVDEFRNVGYLVRPILIVVAPIGVLMPGQNVTIAAYGYGPGAPYYPGYNTLYVYWEKVRLLATVPLGKDGNATFVITIPGDASFGIHYIYGVDAWRPLPYEYTLAITIGARAYWTIPPILPEKPEVSAGYNNTRLEVCPCPGVYSGVGYCDKCVTYVAECDYLGDYIEVTVSGVSPGETLTVRFGTIVMKTVRANSSVETIRFVVPTVPEGTYQIVIVGSVSGTIYVSDYMFLNRTTNTMQIVGNTLPSVVPKVLLLDLEKDIVPILVGPGFVRVIGTGFTPGASMRAVLFNGTDAAFMLNMQVQSWSADSRGVLTSPFTTKAGIYVPVLEPGAYEVSLVYIVGTEIRESKPGFVYVVNNVSILATKDNLDSVASELTNKMDTLASNVASTLDSFQKTVSSKLDSIASDLKLRLDLISARVSSISDKVDGLATKLDGVATTLSGVAGDVSSIKSDVGKIAGAVSDLKSAVDTIKSAADTINTNVGKLSGTLDSISRAVSDVSSKVDTVSGKVDSVSGKVDTVSSAVRDVSGKVDALSGKVDGVASKVDSVSGKVDTVSSAVNGVGSKVDGVSSKLDTVSRDLGGKIDSATGTLQTYIIITLVLALIAAAASIYAVVQLGRKLAG